MAKFTHFFSFENVFIIISLLAGILFAVIVPANQVPDEESHFARVYQIFHGNFTSATTDMPVSVMSFLTKPERYEKIPFFDSDYSGQDDRQETVKYSKTATYSPILYIPQLIGVGLGWLFGMTLLHYFVLGRIFSALFYSGVGYFILKTTPVAKKSLFVLFSMPMSIYLAASYSSDAVQNMLSFLYINFVFIGMTGRNQLSKREWWVFLILGALLALTKPVSLLLIFLSLLIPNIRFKDLRQKLWFVASQLGVSIFFGLGWLKLISYNNFANPSESAVVPMKQLAYILLNPISYIKVIGATWNYYSWFYFHSFVGSFGWLTIYLPNYAYFLFVVALSMAIMADLGYRFVLVRAQKILISVIALFYFVGLLTIMYLVWTPVAGEIVQGVQGRYFIPIFPLVLVLIVSFKPAGKIPWQGLFSGLIATIVPLILIIGVQTVYLRFYR